MAHPELPSQVPQVGNAFTRGLCRVLLRLFGWRIHVRDFPNTKKAVIVVAPHTSNWDWVLGILAIYGIGIRLTWLGKHTLFEGPLRWLFYGLGGIPVNRSAAAGVVDQVVAEFARHEKMIVALAPEGTRKAAGTFRTGYHRMARQAGVPLILASIDYPSREITVGDVFELGSDMHADTVRLQRWYGRYRGRTVSSSHRQQ